MKRESDRFGRKIKVPDEYGITEEHTLLFSFGYDEGEYVVVIGNSTNDDLYVCKEISGSLWNGSVILEDVPDLKVIELSDKLFSLFMKDTTKYPMRGEHYKITDAEIGVRSGYKIVPSKPLLKLTTVGSVFSEVLKWLVTMIMSFVIVSVFTRSGLISWAYSLFPEMQMRMLVGGLYVFQFVGATILFCLQKDEYGITDLFWFALLPSCVVMVLGILKSNKYILWATVLASVLYCVAFIIPKLTKVFKIKNKTRRAGELQGTLSQVVTSLFLCMGLIVIAAKLFGVSAVTYKSNYSARGDSDISAAYNEVVDKLNENVWGTLSMQEKVDILQIICNYECEYDLGCPAATVQAGETSSENTVGMYNNITNTITVRTDYLNETHVYDVVETLLHETRHVWQYTVVEMFNDIEHELDEEYLNLNLFEEIVKYRENFNFYQSGTKDYYDYYDQAVEEDSRSWADFEMLSTYDRYIYYDKYMANIEAQRQQAS